jgi:hypothetical protein
MAHAHAVYPHEGACVACREAKRCNYCGKEITPSSRCTNGRCLTCHGAICTPGGITGPGHGFGRVGEPWRQREQITL